MGLLDILTGGGSPEQNQALSAVAQGLLSANGSQGLGNAMGLLNQLPDINLKRQDLAQQIQLRALQAQMLQRRQDMIGGLLGEATGGYSGSSNASPATQGAPAIPESPGGALGSGTFGMSIPGQSAVSGAPAFSPTQRTGLIQQARQLGIPETAIASDLAFNDGKGIADMLFKRGAPDMQVSNGFAYDKNRLGAGFMPSLTTSQSGQTSMTRIGSDGLPIVSAPQGALDTFGSYKNAEKVAENKNTLLPLGYVDKGTGAPMGGTIAQYLDGQQPPGLRNQGGGTLTPQLQAAILADAQQNGGPAPTVNFTAPGVKNPVFGFDQKQQLPPSAVKVQPVATGQLQSPAEAEAAKIEATAPGAANKAFLEGRAKNMNEYEKSINDSVTQGADMNMRLQEQAKALDQFRAGGGAETRAHLAQMAQAIPGIPQSIVNGIAGGDLSAMQEFNKLAAQTAMEQLKQSMGGAGRISQYEFKVFQNNNPNLSTDPDAIRKIFDFNTRIYNKDQARQQLFQNYVSSGADPAGFPAFWDKKEADMGFTSPNLRAQQPNGQQSSISSGGWSAVLKK